MPKQSGEPGLRPQWTGNVLQFKVVKDGEEIAISSPFDLNDVTALHRRFLKHGVQTLLQQRTSQSRKDGWAATLKEMEKYWEIFKTGEWEGKREVGTRCPTELVGILVAKYKAAGQVVTPADVLAGWKQLDEDGREALLAKHAAAIEAERKRIGAAPAIDLLDLA